MADKETHFGARNPTPDRGHQKGANAHGWMEPQVKLETAPGRLGEAGYVQIAKGK